MKLKQNFIEANIYRKYYDSTNYNGKSMQQKHLKKKESYSYHYFSKVMYEE